MSPVIVTTNAADIAFIQRWEDQLDRMFTGNNASIISNYNTAKKDWLEHGKQGAEPEIPLIFAVNAPLLFDLCADYVKRDTEGRGLVAGIDFNPMPAISMVRYTPPPPPPDLSYDPKIRVGVYTGQGRYAIEPHAHITDGELFVQGGFVYMGHVIASPFNPGGGEQHWTLVGPA